jgi:hypothetical protein
MADPPTGEMTIDRGSDAPLEVRDASCTIKLDVDANVAHARANQSCFDMSGSAAFFDEYTVSLQGNRTEAAATIRARITGDVGGQPQVCQYLVKGTLERR